MHFHGIAITKAVQRFNRQDSTATVTGLGPNVRSLAGTHFGAADDSGAMTQTAKYRHEIYRPQKQPTTSSRETSRRIPAIFRQLGANSINCGLIFNPPPNSDIFSRSLWIKKLLRTHMHGCFFSKKLSDFIQCNSIVHNDILVVKSQNPSIVPLAPQSSEQDALLLDE